MFAHSCLVLVIHRSLITQRGIRLKLRVPGTYIWLYFDITMAVSWARPICVSISNKNSLNTGIHLAFILALASPLIGTIPRKGLGPVDMLSGLRHNLCIIDMCRKRGQLFYPPHAPTRYRKLVFMRNNHTNRLLFQIFLYASGILLLLPLSACIIHNLLSFTSHVRLWWSLQNFFASDHRTSIFIDPDLCSVASCMLLLLGLLGLGYLAGCVHLCAEL